MPIKKSKENKTARHATKGAFGASANKRDYNAPHRAKFWERIRGKE